MCFSFAMKKTVCEPNVPAQDYVTLRNTRWKRKIVERYESILLHVFRQFFVCHLGIHPLGVMDRGVSDFIQR